MEAGRVVLLVLLVHNHDQQQHQQQQHAFRMQIQHAQPHLERGIKYWESVEASVNGVLGGYGLGTLPVVDSLGTRTFILRLLSHLVLTPPATVSDPVAWLKERAETRARLRADPSAGGLGALGRTRALDVGAGVGRVSRDTLLPLVEEVHMVEPVRKFLDEAKRTSTTWEQLSFSEPKPLPPKAATGKGKRKGPSAEEIGRKELRELVRNVQARKSAYFWENTMQDFDPTKPTAKTGATPIDPTLGPEPSAVAEAKAAAEQAAADVATEAAAAAEAPAAETSENPKQQSKKRRTSNTTTATSSSSTSNPIRTLVPGISMPQADIPAELGLKIGEQDVKYDVILIQWCAQHLKDSEMVAFLQRCRAALKTRAEMLGDEAKAAPEQDGDAAPAPAIATGADPLADPGLDGGLIVVKENVCQEDEDGNERVVWDDEDHSITRSRKAYERLFVEAGMRIVKSEVQLGLPAELFEVRQWALR
ncbi:hypothetical protein OC835_006536 [Tilletia horrida]|nr:hypothetical protein OC835_006536 [Tilletia horrida]